MPDGLKRRDLLGFAAGAFATSAILRSHGIRAAARLRFRAVAYDGFALFDPRPIAALASKLVPDKGADLVNLWRVKQFDYQWLSALSGRYQDFWRSTEGALAFAVRSLTIELKPEARDSLLQAWLELKAWPDVPPALRELKQAGLKQAPLANLTPKILEAAIRNSGLEGVFDSVISTDRARTFKPDPRAYQLGVDVLGARREEIVFVPSAGWDAAGSKWFGYPTFWINRSGAPAEELGVRADFVSAGAAELVAFATQQET